MYFCEICKNPSFSPICANCHQLVDKKIINKTKNGWAIKTDLILSRIDQDANFFNPQKSYKLKSSLLTQYEKILYETIRDKLDKNFIVLPQVNLQTIIDTNTNCRNNELYRNLDFCIFDKITLKPILAIELNGENHKTNAYKKQRDVSVRNILLTAELPLVTIENKDLETKNSVEIFNIIQQKLDKIKSRQ